MNTTLPIPKTFYYISIKDQIRIKNSSNKYFKDAWELYENAFPLEERRLLDSQIKLFTNSKYHFDIIIEDITFIGFILWWEFDDLRFVEYFATVEHLRNKGFGKLILDQFIKKDQNPILLEVELPTTEMKKRRIHFYERLGFHLNNHSYEIPPMHDGFPALELLIMTFPQPISEKDVRTFIEQCHPIIFQE